MLLLSSHSDPSGGLALGTLGGVWMFFKGFRVFREYKVVEDTPRINIRSIAMGLVHIRGKAEVEPPILSPVSRTPCCFYKVEIEQWKSEGKSHAWGLKAKRLHFGEVFLEISIVLASLAILTKRPIVWYTAIVSAFIGTGVALTMLTIH